jgi:hypothetical protein
MNDEDLLYSVTVVKHVKEHKKMFEMFMKRKPQDEVKTVEEFKEVTVIFGLKDGCAEELWESMQEAKVKADAEVEGGVTFTFASAMLSIALCLDEGKCADCEHRPQAKDDGIGESPSKMIQ